jgi:hypothetical protein
MKYVQCLVKSLTLGSFIFAISTGVSAHDAPPNRDGGSVSMGPNEALELMVAADCDVKQPNESLVPYSDRSITVRIRAKGSTPGSAGIGGDYIDSITLLPGSAAQVDVPASVYGTFIRFWIDKIDGHGVCRIITAGRTKDSSGNTRTNVIYGVWYGY